MITREKEKYMQFYRLGHDHGAISNFLKGFVFGGGLVFFIILLFHNS